MRAISLLLAIGLAGCVAPPPDSYVGGSASSGTPVAAGADSAGEACTQQARGGAGAVDLFCGSWVQPAGHVQPGGAVSADGLATLASSGAWRAGLDTRFACGEPAASSILGSAPALVLQCTRRVGGWPQVAIAASVDGRAYLADGIPAVLPVMERAIGVMSGRLQAGGALPLSSADALIARRMAAQSFSAGDVGQYEQLMTAGTNANLAESYVAAEAAFRAALALQQKALGRDDPNQATAVMHVALQLSDEGRMQEADALFAQADRYAPRAADPAAPARLLHYEALHALNAHRDADSLALLTRAEAAYAALLPAGALSQGAAIAPGVTLARSGTGTRADPLPGDDVLLDPTQEAALIGVIETRRYRAIALRALGRPAESDAAIADAAGLAAARHMRQPQLAARLYRTAGASAGSRGDVPAAVSGMSLSSASFNQALPGARPQAATLMLRAAALHRQGDDSGALDSCAEAVTQLRALQAGIAPELLDPCLAVYAAEATRLPAERARLAAEMFDAAQLAQSGVTSVQIAQAAARLREAARDPRVGEAIRRRQDAVTQLAELYRQRDELRRPRAEQGDMAAPVAAPETLDARIATAQAGLADSDSALQSASPNYGQLVQIVAPAADVLAALAPGEAFAAITLSNTGGWTFALRDGQVSFAHTSAGTAEMARLVQRMRAGIESGQAGLPRFDPAPAQAIYADTLGQLEPSLAGVTRLVVAPSGPLLSIPFAALLTGASDAAHLDTAPWLIRRFAITHVPAAANFVALRKVAGTSRATRPWFGLGDFRPVTLAQAQRTFPGGGCADDARLFAGLPPLPFARRELAIARTLLGAGAGDEMLGTDFTAAHVQTASLKGYHVLHFAAHALLPSDLRCQSEPAIVTSDPQGAADAGGALLTATAVMQLDLDADMVILSACNSAGPGGQAQGESLSGLARSFFYAGARALMVTHWSVNDQAAALLVSDTLRRLRGGEAGGIAGALRSAQLAMIDSAGHGAPADIAHPFYWAPFALIGEGGSRVVAAGL